MHRRDDDYIFPFPTIDTLQTGYGPRGLFFSTDPAHAPLPTALSVEEQAACFVVGDRSGQALAYAAISCQAAHQG